MKQYHAGIGCRRGVDASALRELLERTLHAHSLRVEQLAGIASIDSKRADPGLHALARELDVPLRFFSAQELAKFEDRVDAPSPAAQRVLDVAGVAETSALAACGAEGVLLGGRAKTVAATCALACTRAEPEPEPELTPLQKYARSRSRP
jgi:cobalt-precorrin 5A hydrolase